MRWRRFGRRPPFTVARPEMMADAVSLVLDLGPFIAVGALVGFAAGLIRTGGGILMAPTLIYALDDTHRDAIVAAIATALAANTLLSLRAAAYHATHRALQARAAVSWALSAAMGGVAGGLAVVQVGGPVLLAAIAACLVLAGLLLPVRDGLRPVGTVSPWVTAPVGVGLGAVSAASGAGGGSFIGATWHWIGLPNAAGHGAVCGVTLGVAALVPLVGLGASALPLSVGSVSLPGALLLALAASLVAPLGARIGAEGPRQLLFWAVAFVMLSMGFGLLRAAVSGA